MTTLQIIKFRFDIIVIATVTIRVDRCNTTTIAGDSAFTPCVVRVFSNHGSCRICDCDNVALQVLDEVVGHVVVENTANAVLVVVEGKKSISIPSFAEDLSAVKRVSVKNTVDLLAGSDATTIILLFARNVNRADDITVAMVDMEKFRTLYEVRRGEIILHTYFSISSIAIIYLLPLYST